MQMTDMEIRRSYNTAANKEKQIQILAELNDCSAAAIEMILFGDKPTSTPVTPPHFTEKPKETVDFDSVKNVLYQKMDELNSQIKNLEEEYRKVTIAIEVLGKVEV